MKIAVFDTVKSNAPRTVDTSWGDLTRKLTKHKATDDKRGVQLWSPCVYEEGASRSRDAVIEVTALALDYDSGVLISEAKATWADYAHVLHTSHSHTQEHHKFRVVIRLASPIPTARYESLWQWANRQAGGELDKQARDPSRMWFVPSAPEGASVVAYAHEGPPLKWTELDLTMPSAAPGVAPGPRVPDDWFESIVGVDTSKALERLKGVKTPQDAVAILEDDKMVLALTLAPPAALAGALMAVGSVRGMGSRAKALERAIATAAKQAASPAPRAKGPADVMSCLDMTKPDGDGLTRVVRSMLNLSRIIELDPDITCRLDMFTGKVLLGFGDTRPKALDDPALVLLMRWISERYSQEWGLLMLQQTLNAMGTLAAFHPVRDYLGALQWDGKPRVDGMLATYAGADDTPLHAAYGRCFLLSMVARVMDPGCKVDTALILQGGQGARKSTFFKELAGVGWFCDTHLDLNNMKDVYQTLPGVWLYEIAEIDTIMRSYKSGTVKALMSSPVDRYRKSHGINTNDVPRQVVFTGSANPEILLYDQTGSRRWHPVTVGGLDIEGIRRDRDQLWAEAFMLYKQGEQWWLSEVAEIERVEASERFQDRDVWCEPVAKWLKDYNENAVTLSELLLKVFDTKKPTRSEQMRAAGVLRCLGYQQAGVERLPGGKRGRVWRKVP